VPSYQSFVSKAASGSDDKSGVRMRLSIRHLNKTAGVGMAIPWAGISGGDVVNLPPVTSRSCHAIKKASPHSPDGTYSIQISSDASPISVYCDMQRMGGGWTLAAIMSVGDDPTFEKRYPNNGINPQKLATNVADDFASLTKAEFNTLFRHGPDGGGSATLRLERNGTVPSNQAASSNNNYLYQKLKDVEAFDAFLAVRNAPMWGKRGIDYKVCADSGLPCNYDPDAHTFDSTTGGEMQYWEYYTRVVNGESVNVGRHGIPADMTSGCEWVQYQKFLSPSDPGYGSTQKPTYNFCDSEVTSWVKLWVK